jgi:hypothetical protein
VAVALEGELEHLVAAVVGEVEVHVGRLAAFEVEEAFEDEPVRHRVDVGDAERIEDERRGRRTADAHADALRAGVVADLLDDVEVVRESGLAEDVELVTEALFELGRDVAAGGEAAEADLGKYSSLSRPGGTGGSGRSPRPNERSRSQASATSWVLERNSG